MTVDDPADADAVAEEEEHEHSWDYLYSVYLCDSCDVVMEDD